MLTRELNFSNYSGNYEGILTKKEIEYIEVINTHAEKEYTKLNKMNNMEVNVWINVIVHNKEHKVYYTLKTKDKEYKITIRHSLIMDLRSSTGYQTIVEQEIYNYSTQQKSKSVDFKDFEKISVKKLEKVLDYTM